MPDSKKVHRQIINEAIRLKDTDRPLMAIFDIDSTLLNVTGRNQAILQEFAGSQEAREHSPEVAAKLESLEFLHHEWGIKKALVRHGVEASLDFFELIRNYWRKHFFSNSHLQHDVPYPGAATYVNSLKEAGAQIFYLTGRARPLMGEGTIKSLREHGFPLDPEAQHLIMKPEKDDEDQEFKKTYLLELEPHNRNIWFFENEPVIINEILKHCPQIKIVYMDTVHSGREEVPDGLHRVGPSFQVSD